MIYLYLIFHIICGVIAYGACYAYFHREFAIVSNPNHPEYKRWVFLCLNSPDDWMRERRFDIFGSLILSLFGPLSLFVIGMEARFQHGFKWSLKPDGIT